MKGALARLRVRPAVAGDRDNAVAVLRTAFFRDPVSVWLVPDDDRRRVFHRGVFSAVFDDALAGGALRVAVDRESLGGVAVWYPPGRRPDPIGADIDTARQAMGDDGLERLAALRAAMAEHHPTDAHCYLWFIAVATTAQGRGIGGDLLAATLGTCDEAGVGAYLDATTDRSRRLYERYGFRATAAMQLPRGPRLHPMWRPRRG